MLGSFKLRIPDPIHFGLDAVKQVGPEAKRLGAGRVMVLSGPRVASSGVADPVLESLSSQKLDYEHFSQVEEEPSLANFDEALNLARQGGYDVFVAVGGGSCMDLTKMVAALMENQGGLADYFGVDLVARPGRPTIMVPTTSGTGSEATRISVFTDKEANMKKVVSSQNILANVAVVDPRLTVTMPPKVTANTGMDAFVHAVESYLAMGSNPITDTLALESIRLTAHNLGPAYANGRNLQARYSMSLASLLAGITLNNAGVGVMHALSFPLGREFKLAHGPALIVIFGETMRALSIADPAKFRNIAQAMGIDTRAMSPWEAAEAAVAGMVNLGRTVNLSTSLAELTADRSRIRAWAEEAHANRRLLDNTPRRLSLEDIIGILERSFE